MLYEEEIKELKVILLLTMQIPQGMLYREGTTKVNVTGSAGQYLDIFIENTGRAVYSVTMNFMTKVSYSNFQSVLVFLCNILHTLERMYRLLMCVC